MTGERIELIPFSAWEKAPAARGRAYVLTPTEEGSAWHLKAAGLASQAFEINQRACASARRTGMQVAAVIGPISEPDFGTLYAHYHEQVKALVLAQPDAFVLSGIRSLENLRAACVAVRELFTDTALYLAEAPSPEEETMCAGFSIGLALRAEDGAPPHAYRVRAAEGSSSFFTADARLTLGPGQPVAYVGGRHGTLLISQNGSGGLAVVVGNTLGTEAQLRRAPCRAIVIGAVPGTREARMRMHGAARFGCGIIVPLLGAADVAPGLGTLVARALCALENARECGLPAGGVLLDLTGDAPELPDSGFWLAALKAVAGLSEALVGLGRLPPALGAPAGFLARAAALGASFLPWRECCPALIAGSRELRVESREPGVESRERSVQGTASRS